MTLTKPQTPLNRGEQTIRISFANENVHDRTHYNDVLRIFRGRKYNFYCDLCENGYLFWSPEVLFHIPYKIDTELEVQSTKLVLEPEHPRFIKFINRQAFDRDLT